jgi:thymidylate synthase (FAD)
MKIEYVDHMGDDNRVCDAARVSFGKRANEYTDLQNSKLIKFLADHDHWSPFAHCFMTVRVDAPIFVARQLVKHTVGFSWNEISARYVPVEPTFYHPDSWRKDSENKQGRGKDLEDIGQYEALGYIYDQCRDIYDFLIESGVSREQARMVLPLGTYTSWFWSGSLAAWARMCSLRMKEDTQYETSIIANGVNDIMKEKFPLSWRMLME